ncbi:MAG TPA: ABC transporter ATP-binding protein [Gemmatimonadales bacterium]|nr:ABC transporter ATP-binding protein [Gemmatimonadales bacterium]
MPPLLHLQSISKRFGAIEALAEASFALEAGEIHALVGENGAGKSTLVRIAYGMEKPDAGAVVVEGVPRRVRSPADARRLGIGMVHQHFTSIPAFTVAENLALAAGWRLEPARLEARVEALARRTGLSLDPRVRAGDLSVGLKQRLEILKALAGEARILLLDEPSAVLTPAETRELLGLLQQLRARGVSSVLITHKLDEALAVADRVTVLRRGRVVFTGPTAAVSAPLLARYMLGEEPPSRVARARPAPGAILVQLCDLAVPRLGPSGSGLRRATLAVRAGEVVGVAAVEGNGQRELLRAVAGLARPAGGSLVCQGPVAFIPEDRTTEGLIGDFTLAENAVLSQGPRAPWVRGSWVDWSGARRRMAALLEAYRIQAAGPEARARTLSGGNQQRLVIALALEREPRVLVAENPTRGLDLKATAEVLVRMREAASGGLAVLVHASDLDELLEVSDRVVVVANGVLHELPPGADREMIGATMLAGGAAWSA